MASNNVPEELKKSVIRRAAYLTKKDKIKDKPHLEDAQHENQALSRLSALTFARVVQHDPTRSAWNYRRSQAAPVIC